MSKFLVFLIILILSSGIYSQTDLYPDLFNANEIYIPKEIKNKLKESDITLKKHFLYHLNITDSTYTTKSKKHIKYKIKPVRLAVVGAGMLGVWGAMHYYYSTTWWKDQMDYFKYAQDPFYAKHVDKISHVYSANAFTVITSVFYEWSGFSPKTSLILGAVTSFAYETYIEVYDGFAPIWGFDWIDVGANIGGALYPFLQKEFPVLKNFNLKWSFKPEWIKKKSENTSDLLDDYTSMTFWLSISPEGLLPKKAAEYYPGFLAIAVGVSLSNANKKIGGAKAYREWYIGLDYDLLNFPGNTEFLKDLKRILNFYRFPAPAVRFSPEGVWYGIYF